MTGHLQQQCGAVLLASCGGTLGHLSLIHPVRSEGLSWLGTLVSVPILGFYYWGVLAQRILGARSLNDTDGRDARRLPESALPLHQWCCPVPLRWVRDFWQILPVISALC